MYSFTSRYHVLNDIAGLNYIFTEYLKVESKFCKKRNRIITFNSFVKIVHMYQEKRISSDQVEEIFVAKSKYLETFAPLHSSRRQVPGAMTRVFGLLHHQYLSCVIDKYTSHYITYCTLRHRNIVTYNVHQELYNTLYASSQEYLAHNLF